MHERPEKLLAEPLVVFFLELRAEKDGDAVEAVGEVRGNRVLLVDLNLAAEAAEKDDLLDGRAGEDTARALAVDAVGVELEVPAVPARRSSLGVRFHLERQRVADDDDALGLVDDLRLLRLEGGDASLHRITAAGVHQLLQVMHRRARGAPHRAFSSSLDAA